LQCLERLSLEEVVTLVKFTFSKNAIGVA
jgi:hypothetical protein